MATTAAVKFLTVPAVAKHTATVIFVHGLGDSGHGWKPVAEQLQADPALAHIKWILPHAPVLNVTANMGMAMPAWFNVIAFGFKSEEDEAGMLQTRSTLEQLISAEVDAGLDPSRIVLGGFSQGAAMSTLTGLTGKQKLAGIAVLSGWVPLRAKVKSMASSHASTLPIFWAHGGADPLVKPDFSKLSTEFLTKELGIPLSASGEVNGLSYKFYEDLPHSASPQELGDLKAWLEKILP